MSKKSIAINIPPRAETPDAWVGQASSETASAAEKRATKRLTIDVPEELHRRLKLACVGRGQMMSEYVRELLQTAVRDTSTP